MLYARQLFVLALLTFVGATVADAQPNRNAQPQTTIAASDAAEATTVRAGGADRNSVSGSGCSGFIDDANPTAAVTFSGSGTFSIYATSSSDATILIGSPDGKWHCSDDASGSNPGVSFAKAPAGKYVVWVGVISPDAAGASAQLFAHSGAPRW